MNRNMNAKWTKTKMISSFALFMSAFLALIAGVKAANPKWRPLYTSALFPPTGASSTNTGALFPAADASSTNLDPRLFREGSTTVYDSSSNRIILFGGFSAGVVKAGILQKPALNDVWILTNANGTGTVPSTWSKLNPNAPSGFPEIRYHHSAVYDGAHHRMIIYGGCTAGCAPIANDVWILSNADNVQGPATWQQLPTMGVPPGPREGHQAVYDPGTNSMIVWAGTDGEGLGFCGSHAYSNVFVLSNANGLDGPVGNWTKLLPTGTPPAGESFSTAVYDVTNNIMIVFGGSGNVVISGIKNCQSTNAVSTLSNATGKDPGPSKWTKLAPQGAVPLPREQHVAVYEPSSNTMTIFGGYFTDHQTGHPRTLRGDTWKLSNANGMGGTPVWTQLIASGTDPSGPAPSFRWNGGTIDTANRVMMFGGSSNDGPLWSTWLLDGP